MNQKNSAGSNDFRVALLQLIAGNTPEENLEKGMEACCRAKGMGADLALFPEMWNVGYAIPEPGNGPTPGAVAADGPFVGTFQALTRELDMAIAITYLEQYTPLPRNTVTVIDRFGTPVLTYAKVHTCDFGEECNLTPGDGFPVAELNTQGGMVKIGSMICYDREFPESARLLMLQGAEILLVPNACPMEQNRLCQLRTRAYENMVGIATANYAYGQPDCNGHSTAFDGMAYGELHPGCVESRDTLVVEAGEAEGIYLATFPMDKLRDYRRNECHGNTYRRPAQYQLLTATEVSEPFVREDARR